MINTTIKPKAGGTKGGRVNVPAPLPTQILDHVDKARATQLAPYRRGTVVGQSADNTKIQIAGVGSAPGGDQMNYPVIVPYLTAQVSDAQGKAYPGGPQPGDDVHILYQGNGNPIVIGQRIAPGQNPPSPFVSGITPGNGIQSTPYADSTVQAPTLAVKAGNGVAVDSTGVKVNPATNGGVTVSSSGVSVQGGNGISVGASGVAVQPASGGVVNVSASGVDVNVSTGIQKAGGALAVNLVAGSGISVSGATISTNLVAGTGISISGATISMNLFAGTGISISGNTISGAYSGSGVISISGATISLWLAANSGFSTAGGLSINDGTGLTISGGVLEVDLVGSSPIGVSGATISLSYGSHLTVSGGALDINMGATFEWTGTHKFDNMALFAGPSYAFEVETAYAIGSGYPPSWATGYFTAYINGNAVKIYFQ